MTRDMLRRAALGLGLAALLAAPAPARQDDQGQGASPEILGQLAGIYDIAPGRGSGADLPDDQLKGKVIVTDGRMNVLDREDRALHVLRYRLAVEQAPDQADFEVVAPTHADAVGSTARGLIKAEGDSLSVIYD